MLTRCKNDLTVLVTTTPEPTPRPRIEYQIATWSLVGASIITLIVIVSLGITLWLRTRALWQPNRLAVPVSASLLHGDLWVMSPAWMCTVYMLRSIQRPRSLKLLATDLIVSCQLQQSQRQKKLCWTLNFDSGKIQYVTEFHMLPTALPVFKIAYQC